MVEVKLKSYSQMGVPVLRPSEQQLSLYESLLNYSCFWSCLSKAVCVLCFTWYTHSLLGAFQLDKQFLMVSEHNTDAS